MKKLLCAFYALSLLVFSVNSRASETLDESIDIESGDIKRGNYAIVAYKVSDSPSFKESFQADSSKSDVKIKTVNTNQYDNTTIFFIAPHDDSGNDYYTISSNLNDSKLERFQANALNSPVKLESASGDQGQIFLITNHGKFHTISSTKIGDAFFEIEGNHVMLKQKNDNNKHQRFKILPKTLPKI